MSTEVNIPMLAEIVTSELANAVVQGWRQVKFRYYVGDPWAVAFDIGQHTGWTRWTFARELLADGLNVATGEGDVHVSSPSHDDGHVYIELSSPSGHVLLRFGRRDIEHALERCEDLVPDGAEHAAVDWEAEWARLGEVA